MKEARGVKATQIEACMAMYVWFIVSYLNYGPNFVAEYLQTYAEVASSKGHA